MLSEPLERWRELRVPSRGVEGSPGNGRWPLEIGPDVSLPGRRETGTVAGLIFLTGVARGDGLFLSFAGLADTAAWVGRKPDPGEEASKTPALGGPVGV